MKDRKRYKWSIIKDIEKDRKRQILLQSANRLRDRKIYILADIEIEEDRYSRSLWISAGIEKDRVMGMQSDRLGKIEMFYLFQSPSSYLFQYFYIQICEIGNYFWYNPIVYFYKLIVYMLSAEMLQIQQHFFYQCILKKI